jgi:hypothetical protein
MIEMRVLLAVCLIAAMALPALAQDAERTVSFAEGQWDADDWTPLKLPLHPEVQTFIQRPDCVGVDDFTAEEKKQHLDNVLLMTDAGTTEGEFEVVFGIGEGAAPGVFLSPTVEGDALTEGIAVFVADYTMAVWMVTTDPETQETEYEHLVRLARYQDPAEKHTLRARWSKARRTVALQVDDSSVVVLRFPDYDLNSKVGIWGCHARSDFYNMTILEGGTLPWKGTG